MEHNDTTALKESATEREDSTEHAPVEADRLRSFADELEHVERQSGADYVTYEVTNTGSTVNLHYNFDHHGGDD